MLLCQEDESEMLREDGKNQTNVQAIWEGKKDAS